MIRALLATALLAASLVIPMTTTAQEAQPAPAMPGISAPNTPKMPKPLEEHRSRGAQVFYLGRYNTLEGWAMIRAGQPEFYYATLDGQALVMGFLFDGDGNLMTGEQLKKIDLSQKSGVVDMMASQIPPLPESTAPDGPQPAAADKGQAPKPAATEPATATPAPAPATGTSAATPAAPAAAAVVTPVPETGNKLVKTQPAESLFAQMQGGSSVLLGNPMVPAFYAFVDPNCEHCKRFLNEVAPSVLKGVVAVRILPVGFTEKSRKQAAFVLASKDGASQFLDYARGNEAALPAPEGLDTKSIDTNTQIMSTWNLDGTPIIVYRAAGSGEVKIIVGRPVDIAAAITDLTGSK